MRDLLGAFSDRSAVVGVVGLGYVGLPLAVEFAARGFRALGFDVDASVVAGINRGTSHVPDVPAQTLRELVRAGRLRASGDFRGVSGCDAVIICVPTPLRKTKEPDVSYIMSACRHVAGRIGKGRLVVLESTTYPGTTRELVLPLLEAGGRRVGRDFHLAFSPERVDPSNQKYGIANTPKVVGGATPACGEAAALLYGQIVSRVVRVSSADAAEMVKLLENTFRAVNIGLINEVALMCHRLGLSVWEIVAAAASKPFGFMPFYPGPGLGGHCIPVDPTYLAWKMKALNFEPRFIDLATAVNSRMPEHVVERIGAMLNRDRKALKGSRILVLGVAYKPDVRDVRESPSLDVIHLLARSGARVAYHDPHVPRVVVAGRRMRSVPLSASALGGADLVAVLTAHRKVDYARVVRSARRVFDARNATAGLAARSLELL